MRKIDNEQNRNQLNNKLIRSAKVSTKKITVLAMLAVLICALIGTIAAYFTSEAHETNMFTIHPKVTITYKYYEVDEIGNRVELPKVETQSALPTTKIVLGADPAYTITSDNYLNVEYIIDGVAHAPGYEFTMPTSNVVIDQNYILANYSVTTQQGTQKVRTLQEALNIADATGSVITVLNNTTVSGTPTNGNKNVTLDLNGKTVNLGSSTITNNGTLTIKDSTVTAGTQTSNGKITSSTTAITNNGTLTIGEDDGTVSKVGPTITGTTYGVQNNANGTFNFYDGKIEGQNGAGSAISGTVTDVPDGYTVYKNVESGVETALLNGEAIFKTGSEVNSIIKTLAAGGVDKTYTDVDTNITTIAKYNGTGVPSGVTAVDVSSVDSETPIYMWYDNGTIYWWSEDSTPSLNENAANMFRALDNLSNIDGVSTFDALECINMKNMFLKSDNATVSPTNVDALSNWNIENVETINGMFGNWKQLQNVNGLSNWNTSSVENIGNVFREATSLSNISALSNWNTESVTNMYCLFYNCSSLSNATAIELWDTSEVENFAGFMLGCSGLTSVDLSNFNTSSAEDMQMMFANCTNLQELDLSNFDTSNVTNMTRMFNACSSLETIYATESFVTTNVTQSSYMFGNNTAPLDGGAGTTYNASNPKDKTYAHLDGGSTNPGYFRLNPDIYKYEEIQITNVGGTDKVTVVKGYATLAEALTGVTNGNTIRPIVNTTETTAATVPSGKTVTLDLNGKTITTNSAITNNGTLIIKDENGAITSTAASTPAITNNGTLTIGEDDGTVSKVGPTITGTTYGVQNNANGTFNFYDGKIEGQNGAGSAISGTVTNVPVGYTIYRDVESGVETAVLGNKYYLTYDYQDNYAYSGANALDTGYKYDWNKNFKIESTFKVTELGKRYAVFSAYNDTTKNLALEITTANKLRIYMGNATLDETSTATIPANTDITAVYEWNAETKTYTLTATGTNVNISMTNTVSSMTGSGTRNVLVGRDERTNVFNPINISMFKISTEYEYNTTISTLPTVTKPGYTYSGWYDAATGGNTVTSVTMPASNKTIYAQKTANTLTFKVYAGGAEASSGTLLTNQLLNTYGPYNYDAKNFSGAGLWNYDKLGTFSLTRKGYTATKYWHVGSASSATKIHEDTAYTTNIALAEAMGVLSNLETGNVTVNLYAGWTRDTYTLTYDLAGGSVATANPTSYNIDTANITLNNPTKVGYTFAGWTEQLQNLTWTKGWVDLSTGKLQNYDSYPNAYFTNAVYLEAGKTYTLSGFGTYDSGDSPDEFRWRAYKTDGSYLGNISSTATCTPTQNCYVRLLFCETSTAEQRSGTIITSGTKDTTEVIQKGSTGNRKFTANWTANNYTITLNPNGGTYNGSTSNSTVTATYESDVNIGYPTRSGYRFTGWKTSDNAIKDNNLLRNSIAMTEIGTSGTNAAGTWRYASTGKTDNDPRTVISVSNPPVSGISKGFQIVGNGSKLDISQDAIPVTVGNTYTISVWAKGTGKLNLQCGNSTYASTSYTLSNVTTWTKYTYTFVAGTNGSANNNQTNIYFGNTTTGTLQLCGMKLEEGTGFSDLLWSKVPSTTTAPTLIAQWVDDIAPVIVSATASTTQDIASYIDFNATDSGSQIQYYAISTSNTAPSTWIPVVSTVETATETKYENSAAWARIFHHNAHWGNVLYSNANSFAEAKSSNTVDKYSVLGNIANYKNSSNWEFLLQYPDVDSTKYNRWTQTDNPTTTTIANGDGSATAGGYTAKHIDWTGNYWGGLTLSTAGDAFINGSVGHSNWYYAIGAKTAWKGGIPGPANDPTSTVNLWARIDNLTTTTSSNLTRRLGDLKSNTTYYVWVKDAAGNTASKAVTVSNVDTTLPTATITSTNSVAASQTATLTLGDNKALDKYYWGTSNPASTNVTYTAISNSPTSQTITKTVSSAGTYYLAVLDKAGNRKVVSKVFYSTTLTPNRGSVSPATIITMAGNSFTIPTPGAVTGYTWGGWYKESGLTTSAGTTWSPTANATLYGKWTANTYTVKYNGNGNTGGSTANSTHTYNTAKALTTNGFTKTGYTFAGWSTSSSDTALVYDDTEYSATVASDASTFSDFKWYSIGGTFASGDVYQMEVDVKGSGTLSNFFYGDTNYLRVASWTSPTAGTSGTSTDGNNTIPLTSSYAHYTVRFTLGSTGTGSVRKRLLFRAQKGCTVSIKNVRFYKVSSGSTGYYNGQSVKNLTSTAGATVNLYALWMPNKYKVTLDNQSATSAGTTAAWYYYNTTYAVNGTTTYYYSDADCKTPLSGGYTITVPTKTGYTFGGYFTEVNGGGTQYVKTNGQFTNNIYQVAGNTTLYAKWTANTATIYYYPNGGTVNSGYSLYTSGTYNGACTTTSTISYGSGNANLYNCTTLFNRSGYLIPSDAQAWRKDSATSTTYINQASQNFDSYLQNGSVVIKLYANWVNYNYGEYNGANYVKGYNTLAEAFSGATSGRTIKVLKDTTETALATLPAGKTITLDTNGKTINYTAVTQSYTAPGNSYTASSCILNNGTLTITGNGTIKDETITPTTQQSNDSLIITKGTLNIKGGTLNAGNQGITIISEIITNDSSVYDTNSNITIGTNDSSISNTTPVIIGATVEQIFYNSTFVSPNAVNFYDGIEYTGLLAESGYSDSIFGAGWYASEAIVNGTSYSKVPNGYSVCREENATYGYKYSLKQAYKIAYNANNGSGGPSDDVKFNGISYTIPTTKPTRSGYTFTGWNTKADGTGTSYAVGASYTGNAALTLYAQWTENKVTVAIKKDGSDWSASGMKVTLYNGTTATSYTATISSGSSAQLSGNVPNGTYNVYIGKDSNHKTDLIDSGVDVTVNNNSPTATVNYYTLTMQTATSGTATVNGTSVANNGTVVLVGGATTITNNYAHTIVGAGASGYHFSSWTAVSGNPTIASTFTANTTVKVRAASTIKVTGAANTVTVTINKDGAAWNASGMKLELRQSNTAKYSVTANTSGAATGVMSAVANGTYDLFAGKHDGAKTTMVDTGTDITVSNNNKTATVNYYTITRSQGTGTTLETRWDSSSGTTFTNNPVVLGNNKVTIYGKATINTAGGYRGTATLKHGSTTMTASGSTFTVSAAETIASAGATANKVTVNINKDGTAWSNSGMKVTLYNGTTATSYTATISSGSSAQLSGAVPNGTYNVYIGKDSNHKTDLIDSGVDVTVNNNSPTATVNYYTLTMQTATSGTATVNGTSVANNGTVVLAGGTTTTANNYAHAIVGAGASGYHFSSWTAVSGSPTIASTSTASTTVKVGAASTIKVTGAANTVTVTINKDGSAWNASGMKLELRQSNTVKYSVTANTSGAATGAMSAVANGTYDLFAGKHDGAKTTMVDTGTDITVSNNNKTATVNYYTITRSQGTGTTLTTKYDSSSGTTFTNNPVVLKGVTIYGKAVINVEYIGTATLKHGNTTMTASGATFTVSAKETVASGGATAANYGEYNGSTWIRGYMTLNEAFTQGATGNTIKVLKNTTETTTATLSDSKTFILDTNSKTITFNSGSEICVANGTLTVQGSGKVYVTGSVGIRVQNSSKLTVNTATVESTTYQAIMGVGGSSSSITINSGAVIKANEAGIYNYGQGTVTVNGGSITGNDGILTQGGTVNAYAGTITGSTLSAISNGLKDTNSPTVIVIGKSGTTGPTLSGAKGVYSLGGSSTGKSTVTIYSGSISGTDYGIHNIGFSNITISGGTITTNGIGIEDENSYTGCQQTITISGGTITAVSTGIDGNGSPTITMTGGTITSSTDVGIRCKNTTQLTLGKNDGNISTTSPSVTGSFGGLTKDGNAKIYFYDGKIVGKSGSGTAIRDGYTALATGAQLNTALSGSTETVTLRAGSKGAPAAIDEQENLDDVEEKTMLVSIGEANYETLAEAVLNAKAGDTITLLESINLEEELTIAKDKNIVLCLNGKTLTTSAKAGIVNNGTLEIKGLGKIIIPEYDAIGILHSDTAEKLTISNNVEIEISAEELVAEDKAEYERIINTENYENTKEFKDFMAERKQSIGICNNSKNNVILESATIKVERLNSVGIENNGEGSIILGKEGKEYNSKQLSITATSKFTTAIVNNGKGKIEMYGGTISSQTSIKEIISKVLADYEISEETSNGIIITALKKVEEKKEEEVVEKEETKGIKEDTQVTKTTEVTETENTEDEKNEKETVTKIEETTTNSEIKSEETVKTETNSEQNTDIETKTEKEQENIENTTKDTNEETKDETKEENKVENTKEKEETATEVVEEEETQKENKAPETNKTDKADA